MVASANSFDKNHSSSERLKVTKESFLFPFWLHPLRNLAITWPSSLLFENGLRHLVPHVILHLMIYIAYRYFQNGGPCSESEVDF